MKIILDTNVLIASIGKRSQFRPIYNSLLNGDFTLAVSTEILLEYAEIIEKKTSPTISQNIMELLSALPNVLNQEIYYNWKLIINDPDDDKFVDCYVASGAGLLVSNDRHFSILSIDDFPPIRVIQAEEFLKLLSYNDQSIINPFISEFDPESY